MNQHHVYRLPIRVEFEDVDSYGIAHHTKLIGYLERARVRFFHEGGIEVHDGDFHLVLVDLQVRFKEPALMMDEVDVCLWVEKLGGASLVWGYALMKQDRELLRGSLKMASVDANKKPCAFPEKVKSHLLSLVQT